MDFLSGKLLFLLGNVAFLKSAARGHSEKYRFAYAISKKCWDHRFGPWVDGLIFLPPPRTLTLPLTPSRRIKRFTKKQGTNKSRQREAHNEQHAIATVLQLHWQRLHWYRQHRYLVFRVRQCMVSPPYFSCMYSIYHHPSHHCCSFSATLHWSWPNALI